MAKSKMYLQLGEKASSFYDPLTRVDIKDNRQVVEVNGGVTASKVVSDALKGGHIKKVTEEEYLKFKKKYGSLYPDPEELAKAKEEGKSSKAPIVVEELDDEDDEELDDEDDEEQEEEDDETSDDVDSMSKSELVASLEGEELTDEEKRGLKRMNLEQLKSLYRKYN